MKRYLLIGFITLQVLDVVTTQWALASCPVCYEGNPVVAATMAHLGALWWVPKMALMAALVPALARGRTSFVATAVAFCAVIVVSNIMS